MATDIKNANEDADMAECEGEKVVTMMDVLKEQEDFEEDANAVLGGSDDKNCTYSKVNIIIYLFDIKKYFYRFNVYLIKGQSYTCYFKVLQLNHNKHKCLTINNIYKFTYDECIYKIKDSKENSSSHMDRYFCHTYISSVNIKKVT